MSKAVMISIRPKWCEKIARGEKTIEVRKTRPKLETPFKCYIYCTQASVRYQTICGCHVLNSDELYRHPEQGIKHGDSIELMLCRLQVARGMDVGVLQRGQPVLRRFCKLRVSAIRGEENQ